MELTGTLDCSWCCKYPCQGVFVAMRGTYDAPLLGCGASGDGAGGGTGCAMKLCSPDILSSPGRGYEGVATLSTRDRALECASSGICAKQ